MFITVPENRNDGVGTHFQKSRTTVGTYQSLRKCAGLVLNCAKRGGDSKNRCKTAPSLVELCDTHNAKMYTRLQKVGTPSEPSKYKQIYTLSDNLETIHNKVVRREQLASIRVPLYFITILNKKSQVTYRWPSAS